jgi:hypothetical protein
MGPEAGGLGEDGLNFRYLEANYIAPRVIIVRFNFCLT